MSKNPTGKEILTLFLSYTFILVLLPLFFIKNKNDFEKFHILQGFTFFIALTILIPGQMLMFHILIIGWFFAVCIWILIPLLIIFAIIAFIKGLKGHKWEMPILNGYTKYFKSLV